MPLSEQEQEVLERIEQSLAADDPDFASQMSVTNWRPRRRLPLLEVVAVILGLAALVLVWLAATRGQWWWLAAAAGLLLAGLWAIRQKLPQRRPPNVAVLRTAARRRRMQRFMQQMEQRWEQRRRHR